MALKFNNFKNIFFLFYLVASTVRMGVKNTSLWHLMKVVKRFLRLIVYLEKEGKKTQQALLTTYSKEQNLDSK